MDDAVYDVAILGGGVAGAAAAYGLRGRKAVLLEAEPFIGGRTYSEQFQNDVWANYGAGYFSSDKSTIIGLGDAVDARFVRFDDGALAGDFVPDAFSAEDVAEIRQIRRRIAAEQARRREPSSPELDERSFGDWLGPVRPNVQSYWEAWCSTMSGPMHEISLYGVLLMNGANRTTAFSDEPVAYDSRGNLVVEGGNGLIAQQLVAASGIDVLLQHAVMSVQSNGRGGYDITATTPAGKTNVSARAVICAMPAPATRQAMSFLPAWKHDALSHIVYGRITGLPVVVGPKAGGYDVYAPSGGHRPDAVYCETEFALRSPTDLDRDGAYFVCQVYDRASGVIWDDSDDSIRSGVFAAFAKKFPELAGRVIKIGVRRWLHGLPRYSLGRMAATPALVRAVDGVFFCGDYTDVTHTDGAAKSGLRAASETQAYLGAARAR